MGRRVAQVAVVILIIAQIEAIAILIAAGRMHRTGIATPIMPILTEIAITAITRTVGMAIRREDFPIVVRIGVHHISV